MVFRLLILKHVRNWSYAVLELPKFRHQALDPENRGACRPALSRADTLRPVRAGCGR
jgi:hypothetical protein